MKEDFKKKIIESRKAILKETEKIQPNKDIVMGIDLSKESTGVAVIDKKTNKIIYIDNLKKIGNINKNNIIDFYLSIYSVINKFKPELIIIEEIFYKSSFVALKTLAKYHGILEIVLVKNNINYIYVPTQRAKAFLKCKTKEAVFEKLNKDYNLKYVFEKDNDKTDALMLALNHNNELIYKDKK